MLPILIFALLSLCSAQTLPNERFVKNQVNTRMLRARMAEGPTHRVSSSQLDESLLTPCLDKCQVWRRKPYSMLSAQRIVRN